MTTASPAQDHRGEEQTPPRIAAVVRLAGEEPRIDLALRSVAWADEQIAVDLGSNESTIRECGAHGVALIEAEKVPAEIARRGVDWVLLIEGYEEVSPALVGEIRGAMSIRICGDAPVAYRIRRRVRFLGRTLRSRAWAAPHFVRLARRDAVSWNEGPLTVDSLPVKGYVACLGAPLLAEPCAALQEYVSRMNILTNAAAREPRRARVPVGWPGLAVGPAVHALRALPGAVARDGMAGMILAVLETYSMALTCAKRWELERARGLRPPA
jgi:hypothetical protein